MNIQWEFGITSEDFSTHSHNSIENFGVREFYNTGSEPNVGFRDFEKAFIKYV